MHDNRRSGIAVQDPRNADERMAVAQACGVQLQLEMPMAVDAADNAVASTYGGWPDRLYLIDRAGRIAYQAAEGPFGFKPDELEGAISRS